MAGPGQVEDAGRALAELAARLAGDAPSAQYIRAYHGSPYDWDRVDMSMVGKGEGPLDEGFGFYATSSPGAANWYRQRTTHIRRQALANQMREVRSGFRAAPNDPLWHAKYHRAIRLAPDVHAQRARLQREFPRGATYELEIAQPIESLLAYDLPVYQQRPEVLERMRQVDPSLVDSLVDAGRQGLESADGAMFYNTLSGGTLFDSPTARGQKRASTMLFEAGIPGHTYQNTNPNYVFYPGTEDSIRILRKYAVPGAIGAGAASGMQDER